MLLARGLRTTLFESDIQIPQWLRLTKLNSALLKGVTPSQVGPPVVHEEPLQPVPGGTIRQNLKRAIAYLPTLTAPSQLELMPRFALCPAATLILLFTVPKLVCVYKKTASLQELTTFKDWA